MKEIRILQPLKRLFRRLFSTPIWFATVVCLILGFAACIIGLFASITAGEFSPHMIYGFFLAGFVVSGVFVYPWLLTLENSLYLVMPGLSDDVRGRGRAVEYVTFLLGSLYSLIYAIFRSDTIKWGSDWTVQLYNSELHAPIATWTWPTLITVFAVAFASYLILRFWKFQQLPPLVGALAIGGLYLGTVLCVIWFIQFCKRHFLLCLFPLNLILINAKVIKEVIHDWNGLSHEVPTGKTRLILFLYNLLYKAQNWTWIGFLLAFPLLGILIAVLTLFGQAPDSIIQAWTETSDWTLSQQVAPQNIHMDMHYLCTVAAGGHKKVVKPLRVGKRHGHRVLVNRQLCIANAFEQLLEERIPRIHRVIRNFYDKYGYPIAKHIRSPYTADLIWFLMKPLEWFFLIVLYLFDKKPENRIAVQYPHAPIP